MKEILLIDVGGTNVRYAYATPGEMNLNETNKISLTKMTEFNYLLKDLLKSGSVKSLVLSVAGPKINGSISMTNRNFQVSAPKLMSEHQLEECYLLNDWESIGYSLITIKNEMINIIKTGKGFTERTLFIGPGTGLGAALVINKSIVVPTEIGNTTSMTNKILSNYGISDTSYLTLEDVISGTAIKNIYSSLSGKETSPEEVVSLFKQGDELANKVINGFTISIAQIASDFALIYLAGNGIYFAGGLMRTIFEIMDKDLFLEHFLAEKKDQHREMLNMIPVGVINTHHTCLYGNLNFYNMNLRN